MNLIYCREQRQQQVVQNKRQKGLLSTCNKPYLSFFVNHWGPKCLKNAECVRIMFRVEDEVSRVLEVRCVICIRPFSWGVSLYGSAVWGVFCSKLQQHIIIFPAEIKNVWRWSESVRSWTFFSSFLWHYWPHVEIKCRKALKRAATPKEFEERTESLRHHSTKDSL